MKHYNKVICLPLLLTLVWFTASCRLTAAEREPAEHLASAQHLTSEIRSLMSAIFRDITRREYRFDADARREAFGAARRLKAVEFMAIIREIAAMPISESDRNRLADVIAVSGALAALTDLREPGAQALNTQRLSDDALRGFVIQNLKILEAWEATPAVESALLEMRMSPANGKEVAAMLDFVLLSSVATGKVCAAVDRVLAVYPDCWRSGHQPKSSFCADLLARVAELGAKNCTGKR